MEAWPSSAWIWAGSAPPWRSRVAKARDSGIGARGEDDLGDAGVSERPALPGPERAGVAVAHGKPG
jgi:hypothetical protein